MPLQFGLPIPAYLIDHPKGQILFDAGMHPELQTNPRNRLGAWADAFQINYRAGDDVASQLRKINIDPEKISTVVSSHLHFTHAGGLELLPNAQIILQDIEWEAANRSESIIANNYNPADYQHGHSLRKISGEYDVFGDGSVVAFTAFGHTPGSQALRIKLESGNVILTSDACYFKETLEHLHLPRIVADRSEMLRTLLKFQDYQRDGARIFYGHDASFWRTIPLSPACLR